MMPAMTQVLSRARRSIDTKQYSMDHSEGFSILEQSITRYSTRLRILHDKDKFWSPSCAQQTDRLRALATVASELGKRECLEVRTLKPGRRGFSSQHSKTWVLDEAYFLGGSANMTHNSENNFEEVSACKSVIWDLKRK